jgi:methionyl-tRNA formyltransferase
MKVVLLSPYPEALVPALLRCGDDPIPFNGPPTDWPDADFLVSYGYRHIVREAQLNRHPGQIINLHISYLPWNRGADPNFWSFYDDTPKGVSIHQVDRGIDSGPLLARRALDFALDETLATSYAALRHQVEQLFASSWPRIREEQCESLSTAGLAGSAHRSADKDPVFRQFMLGWHTPVGDVVAAGRRDRSRRGVPAADNP